MRNTLIKILLPTCAGVMLFACSNPPSLGEGTHKRSSSIINGTASSNPDDDSVVLLWMGDSFCTGSLIAPNVVLTARHCVSDPGQGDECAPFGPDKDPSTIGVALGEHPSSQAIVARGAKLFLENKSTICGQDIALIQLDTPVNNVKVKKVRLTAPVANEMTTAIGYGQDENEQINGRMMRSGVPIQAVGPSAAGGMNVPANDFMTGESVCHGDSGGPLFDAQGQILGTTSRGGPQGCVNAPAIFSSTAAHATLIKTTLAAAGHPLDATPPTTPATDAGAPPPASSSGGTTVPGGGSDQPSGPTPGSATNGGDDEGSDNSGDNDSSDDTSDKKKKGGSDDESPKKKSGSSSSSGGGAQDNPPLAVTASGCSASPSEHTNSGGGGMALFLALAMAASVVRRRR